VVLNDVVTAGSLAPPSPSAEPFAVSDYQIQLTLPSSFVSAWQALGNTSISGSLTASLDTSGNVQPFSVTVGPLAFDLPIPGSVPSSGLGLDVPPSPTIVGGFFSTPFTIAPGNTAPPSNVSLFVGSTMTLTLNTSGSPSTLTCTAYPNDAITTSGITTSGSVGSPITPMIANSTTGTTSTLTASSTTPTTPGSGPYYLALGDSVPVWNGNNSYPYLIAANYSSTNPGLQVVDMACSSETTGTMLANSLCAPAPQRSQQQEAVAFLQAHQGQVALITIDIGGNDLLPCVNGLTVNLSCIQQAESTMVQNLDTILNGLRQAVGPTVPIVGMNYYDPFLGDWLAGGSTQVLANLSVSLVTNLNTLLAGAYQRIGAPVADVETAFHTTDLTDMVSSPWGSVPVAVDKACTLLDITCTVGQPEGFGDDPVPAGATVIAQAFEQIIGTTISPTTTTTTTASTTTTTASTTTTTGSTTTTTGVTTTTGSTTTTTGVTTSTSPQSVTSSTAPATANAVSSSSSNPSRAVTAASGSLAFTGSGPGLNVLTLLGSALVLVGLVLLVLVDVPRRVLRQLSFLSPTRRGRRS
jgi:lysophospholipase L1-like esterase